MVIGAPVICSGRHVRERADQPAGLGLAEVDQVRDAEVAELGGAARVEEHVGGLEIAVDDAAMVRELEAADELEAEAAHLRAGRPLAAGEALGQRAAGRYSITRKP
jgi:hypothetical protein